MAPKRPEYGDATPEDLARALLSAPAEGGADETETDDQDDDTDA